MSAPIPAVLDGRLTILGVEYPTCRVFVIARELAIWGALALVWAASRSSR